MPTIAATRRSAAVLLLALSLPTVSACSAGNTSPTASPSVDLTRPSAPSPPSGSSAGPAPSSSTPAPVSTPSSPAAASGSQDAAYCKALKAAKDEITAITGKGSSPKTLQEFVDAVQKVQSKAPDRVKKEWTEFLDLSKKAAAGDVDTLKTGAARIQKLGDTIGKDGLKNCGVSLN